MTMLRINAERCKACGYCVLSCPKKALALSDNLNTKGYQMVVVKDEKCNGCGICYTVCPDGVFALVDAERVAAR
ncbi:MAG: 4Fe-4S binding protein [Anaerolineales bacterium]|nr:4Fe-4S binding protein [Anaerolineales bacterium]